MLSNIHQKEVRSVSYTHLFHGLSDNRLPPAQRTVSDERLNCSPFGVLATGYIQTPVSYTHLDVYKRQGQIQGQENHIKQYNTK